MDWRVREQLNHQRQKAERELQEMQVAEQQRLRLKAQFAEQQRRQEEHTQRLLREETEREQTRQQQQALAHQRVTDGVKRLDEQREVRQRTARTRTRTAQAVKVWQSRDGREFRSPVERDFWDAWQEVERMPLHLQYPIGKYRVDFAHLPSKTIIEIDGRRYHTNKRAFTHDRVRERYLEKQGWRIIHFSADEILTNVDERIAEVSEVIQERM